MGAKLFNADGRTDRQTDGGTKEHGVNIFFCNFANTITTTTAAAAVVMTIYNLFQTQFSRGKKIRFPKCPEWLFLQKVLVVFLGGGLNFKSCF